MLKRILGVIIILVAISGLLIGIGGVVLGRQAIDGVEQSINDTLPVVLESLSAVEDSLLLAKDTMNEVSTSLDTVEQATLTVSKSITDAAPAVEQVVVITGEDVPEAIEAFQSSIPNLVNVAATIDSTLQALADFKIETSILTFPLEFDLGIEYDPEAPFDESIAAIGTSTEELPEQMRSLATELDATSENLLVLGDDIEILATDISDINMELREVPALLDRYVGIVQDLESNISNLQQQLSTQFSTLKLGITIVMIWFCLTQIAPLVLGWELIRGGFDREQQAESTVVTPPPPAPPVAEERTEAYTKEAVAAAESEAAKSAETAAQASDDAAESVAQTTEDATDAT